MDVRKGFSGCLSCSDESDRLLSALLSTESPVRIWAFRSSIIMALITSVATILYFTPLPDHYPQSCSRSCHELDWPMICRIKLTLERYRTMSGACGDCPKNQTDCYERHCITGDGKETGILAVNRLFPGPDIQVCQNDIVVVDVVNRISGRSFGVHWRGQDQRETPHMDGVPMITQCPIPSFTTFQYKFRASQAGTHMWQINTGEELMEMLFGAFIVRKPTSQDTHRHLYDTESTSHVVTIHTLTSQSKSKILINGKVQDNGVPAAFFEVTQGFRYRFRAIFGGDTNGCRIRLSVDDHQLLVFALDGNPIEPRNVTAVRLSPGERVDFVLMADRQAATYSIRATPEESCVHVVKAVADLRYRKTENFTNVNTNELSPKELVTVNEVGCDLEDSSLLCPNSITSPFSIPKTLTGEPDHKFFLMYSLPSVSSQAVYNTSFIAAEDIVKVPQVNNVTMIFPSSPLLTQSKDVTDICDGRSLPPSCRNKPDDFCECVHVLHIRMGTTVELILVNEDESTKLHRVFHLHGYKFWLVGSTVISKRATATEVDSLVRRNLKNPVVKDTVALPRGGIAVIRFKADNPGYWLLDEEHSSSWTRGMSVILHVGKDSDVPSAPPNFPRCGNWIGPEYFLV